MHRRTLFRISVILIVIIGIGIWAVWPRSAGKISESQAVSEFRSSTTQPENTATTTSHERGTVTPTAGVYRFNASGREKVSFGPLPEATHNLARTITGVVEKAPRGCFGFTLNLFTTHTEDSTFCASTSSLTLTDYAKHETIGALKATANITCDPGALISSDQTGHDLECVMSLEGGPFPAKAEFAGTAKASPKESMTIGGESVEVTPVTVHFTFASSVKGTWTEKMWFTNDYLPVRISRTLDMNGPASFDENFELQVASLTPKT